jgi:MYXO-CTERM domain-containing protein
MLLEVRLPAAGFGLLIALWPRFAGAYECTPVQDVRPALTQAWTSRCIPYFINPDSVLFGDSGTQLLVAQSFRVWTDHSCTDLELRDFGNTTDEPGFDENSGRNRNVLFVAEDPADLDLYFSDPMQLAVTLTSHSVSTGEIFDADIVVNDIRFDFADVTSEAVCVNGSVRPYDLRNMLIHEMGHFIGFDHDQTDRESTMYASAQPCEINKRTLTTGDAAGVCDVYAKGQETMTCAPPADGYGTSSALNKFRDRCEADYDEGDGSICSCRGTERASSPGAALALLLLFFASRAITKPR